ncbi:MAG TPA: PilZ domain-containing protein [Gammaproteobacteria bacterium]|nr:PilZ domain-containing protein [Gammaproteobacteria bacterium]
MDHRMNMRVGVEVPVELRTANRTVRGLAVGLSFEGLSVSVDNAPPLDVGMVWVHFEPDTTDVAVPAIVVHQNHAEVGLMFGDYDGKGETYIGDVLSGALDRGVKGAR